MLLTLKQIAIKFAALDGTKDADTTLQRLKYFANEHLVAPTQWAGDGDRAPRQFDGEAVMAFRVLLALGDAGIDTAALGLIKGALFKGLRNAHMAKDSRFTVAGFKDKTVGRRVAGLWHRGNPVEAMAGIVSEFEGKYGCALRWQTSVPLRSLFEGL